MCTKRYGFWMMHERESTATPTDSLIPYLSKWLPAVTRRPWVPSWPAQVSRLMTSACVCILPPPVAVDLNCRECSLCFRSSLTVCWSSSHGWSGKTLLLHASEMRADLSWTVIIKQSFCTAFSSGPQRCAACQQEGIFEEPASILDTSSVSASLLLSLLENSVTQEVLHSKKKSPEIVWISVITS